MKIYLRHIPSGHYFQSLERWTPDRDDAHDFDLIPRALRFAHRSGLPDLELVLRFDSPEQMTAIPFEKFQLGLSRTRRMHEHGGFVPTAGMRDRRCPSDFHGARCR